MALGHHVLLHRLAGVPLRSTVETLVIPGNDEMEICEEGLDIHQQIRRVDMEAMGLGHVDQILVQVWASLVAEQTLRLIELVVDTGRRRAVVIAVGSLFSNRSSKARFSIHGGSGSGSGSGSAAQWH